MTPGEVDTGRLRENIEAMRALFHEVQAQINERFNTQEKDNKELSDSIAGLERVVNGLVTQIQLNNQTVNRVETMAGERDAGYQKSIQSLQQDWDDRFLGIRNEVVGSNSEAKREIQETITKFSADVLGKIGAVQAYTEKEIIAMRAALTERKKEETSLTIARITRTQVIIVAFFGFLGIIATSAITAAVTLAVKGG